MKTDKTYKFLLSGGGTGGHIYPALAIANELKHRLPNSEFLFVGALGKMEMEKVPKAGFEIIGLPIIGLSRSLSLNTLKFPFKLIQSLFKAKKIVKKFQPDVVIGTGGFASGPTLMAAQGKGKVTVVQEQNSLPGLTNKRLAKKAKKLFVAYPNMSEFFAEEKIVETGNPIRKELFQDLPNAKEAKAFFGLDENKPVILSVGGSLGSRTLNNVWKANVQRVIDADCQLIWQTGSLEFNAIPEQIKQKEGVSVNEFIYKMNMAYAAADVIVSRAGAIAISELAVIGKPIILVPFPFAAENHQYKNAKALADENAAMLVEDSVAENTLASTAINLVKNTGKQEAMKENIQQFAKPNATKTIVDEILKLIEQ